MDRILLATDFSPHANGALAHAIRFADAFEAELHLLNVLVPYGPSSPLLEEFPGEPEARAALDRVNAGTSHVVRAVARGIAAAPTILDYADEHEIDLIVMGSHGRRGVRRFLLGSVTEEVLRSGRWPVLTVHQAAKDGLPRPEYGHILAPVDFSAHTEPQVEMAAALARRFGATLELVHVVDPPIVPELYMPIAPLVVDVKRATDQAMRRLGELAEPLKEELTVGSEVLVGGSVREIMHRAKKRADLIVMPTHGYQGLDRILMGSVAEGVLRRATCPVLVLKPEEAEASREEKSEEAREEASVTT